MGFETLIYAIFRQTFEDYNELIESGYTYSTSHTSLQTDNPCRRRKPAYSLDEIRNFLSGDWCETLLGIIEKDEDPTAGSLINQALFTNEKVFLPVYE